MPNEVMALTTRPRSSTASWRRVAASLGADEDVEGAAASTGADEDVEDAAESTGADEGVEECGSEAQVGIIADPGWSGIGVPDWLTAATSTISSLGRESASATTFALP